jgi:beta-xylosidase
MTTHREIKYQNLLLFLFLLLPQLSIAAQAKNPVLFADYSDPDVIRDGKDFYLIASTFHFVPGIPILHSLDLVHWEISGHVVSRLTMSPAYNMEGGDRYAGGIWAPSVRFHNGLFYVYFPTPTEGIFVATAPKMTGPWSAPQVVLAGPGYEDPCPFWDEDGQAYLVHSKLRAGPLILHRMSPDGKHLLDEGKIIVQDPVNLPTLEGPKFYKRNGWYYILAPMGGVGTGSQVALRSRNLYGPYESHQVLAQGSTAVNGPHQGGLVDACDGCSGKPGGDWFLHFQQRGAHGRIVWLEPVAWQNDWPVMGAVKPGEPVGQPVNSVRPLVHSPEAAALHPATSDEFNTPRLSAMWEWNHNPDDTLWSLTQRPGFLRLHPSGATSLKQARNTLTETMQDESLRVTTRLDTTHLTDGVHTGLSLFDRSLSSIAIVAGEGTRHIIFTEADHETIGPALPAGTRYIQLRAELHTDTATYAYSFDDGRTFHSLGTPVQLAFSWWKGARPALFAWHTGKPSTGYVDFDWMHYEPLPQPAG